MKRKYCYTGINSVSFIQGFDPETLIFDKSLVEGFKIPEKYFAYLAYVDYTSNGFRILHGPSCGSVAQNRADKHGGAPLVVRVNLSTLPKEKYIVEHEFHSGKLNHRRVTIEPSKVEVDSLYLVKFYLAGGINLLKETTLDQIS